MEDSGEFVDVAGFWKWAYSDLLENVVRGVLAEYIVALAADCRDSPRIEWNAYDLKTKRGMKVEVKSAAFLQSWHQPKLSTISFDIRPSKGWDAATNTNEDSSQRSAECYVFCHFVATEKENANPLDLNQWQFYAVNTVELNARFGDQKSVRLSVLRKFAGDPISFQELRVRMRQLDGVHSAGRSSKGSRGSL